MTTYLFLERFIPINGNGTIAIGVFSVQVHFSRYCVLIDRPSNRANQLSGEVVWNLVINFTALPSGSLSLDNLIQTVEF